MPKTLPHIIVRALPAVLATALCGLAATATFADAFEFPNWITAPKERLPLLLAGTSVCAGAFGLALGVRQSTGRPLSLMSMFVSLLILFYALYRTAAGYPAASTNMIACSAAFVAAARLAAIAILPPLTDRNGIQEALLSLLLALGAGAVWLFADPDKATSATLATLVLSWPVFIDGINTFADAVFRRAATSAGARRLRADCFTRIAACRHIVIDKAAVMSGPDLMVTNIMAFNNEPKTLLAVAASAEAQSNHPVAIALRHLAEQWRVSLKVPDRFEAAPGLGVVALLGGQTVVIGTTDLLRKLKIDSFTADAIARSLEADGKTVLRVAVGDRVVGVFGLEGTLRQDAGVAGAALRREGLTPWLFSGDNPKTRETLAGMLNLDVVADPRPGETAPEATLRCFREDPALILSLSQDRSHLELRFADAGASDAKHLPLLAISDTDEIGAFPALKALASRRNALARHARWALAAFWLAGGLAGALLVLPIAAQPVVLSLCLAVLWIFARISVGDGLRTK